MTTVTLADYEQAIDDLVDGRVQSVKLPNGTEYTLATVETLIKAYKFKKSLNDDNEGGIVAQNVAFQ